VSDPALEGAPTHAGGVVWRRTAGALQFLLVRPLDGSPVWVLPKGHIEAGETPAVAAVREVREEAGVVARLSQPEAPPLGVVAYTARGQPVRCAFYALRWLGPAVGPAESPEDRLVRWATLAEVGALVPFPETVALVAAAARIV